MPEFQIIVTGVFTLGCEDRKLNNYDAVQTLNSAAVAAARAPCRPAQRLVLVRRKDTGTP